MLSVVQSVHLKKESTSVPTYNPPVTQKPPVTYTQPNTYAPKPTEPWNGEFPKGSLHTSSLSNSGPIS